MMTPCVAGFAIWLLLIAVAGPACAGNGKAAGNDPSLQAALQKTLAADGFHIEGTMMFEGRTFESEGNYVAPDRMFISSSEGTLTTATTIVVGRDHYVSEPEDPDTYSLWKMPCEVGIDTFIPALAVAREAAAVAADGDAFTFQADGNEGTRIEGEAHVEDGYLVGLTLRYKLPRLDEDVEERWTFSDFGTTVRIAPPRADQVLGGSMLDDNPPIVPSTGSPPECP